MSALRRFVFAQCRLVFAPCESNLKKITFFHPKNLFF